jgi:predicted amidohydrolase
MRVTLYQFQPVYHDISSNREKIITTIGNLETDLIVLPELALSGYTFSSMDEAFSLSEQVPGETASIFQRLCDRMGFTLVYGFIERSGEKLYNSAACIRPEEKPVIYRKAHLFNTEKHFFTPGDTPFEPIEACGTTIGVLVCYDHLYPEAARVLARKGARIICHPSNLVLPGTAQLTTRVRSLENRVFWILTNRIGSDPQLHQEDLHFTGLSQITSPTGKILAQAGKNDERIISCTIDPDEAANKQITPANEIFTDLRDDLYQL